MTRLRTEWRRAGRIVVGLALYPAWVFGYLVGAVVVAVKAIVNAFRIGYRRAR